MHCSRLEEIKPSRSRKNKNFLAMKKNKAFFFDMFATLSPEEAGKLGHFARASLTQSSKKAINLLELAGEAPSDARKPGKLASWLKRKLYPNDDTGRYFQKVLKESEEILRSFIAFRELQGQAAARQFLLLEALPLPAFEEEFKEQLSRLKNLLDAGPARSSRHALDSYRYELMHEKLITRQKDKGKTHNYYATLEHLDRFYLIEKLKYATALKLWSNIYREEPPASLARQIEFLVAQLQEGIKADPVLRIYLTTYKLYYNEAGGEEVTALPSMLEKHAGLFGKEELNGLYNLAANYYINKINSKPLSPSELRQACQENFKLIKFQSEQDMLREGEFIPSERFQNVIAAALSTGEPENLDWAENFLKEKISLVQPGNYLPALEKFNRAAIHFYRGEFEKCFESLENFPYTNRFFYYCDVNSLRLRAQFESSWYVADYWDEIQKVKKRIKSDEALSTGHRQGYLNFFELLKQLFKTCEQGKPEKEELSKLKARVEKTHPVAQKKWLMEKVDELRKGS